MNGKKSWFLPSKIDVLLLAVAAILIGVGALLLRSSPAWWGWYLSALEIRIWPAWKAIGVVIVLLESGLVIRYWPKRRLRRQGGESHE